MTATTRIEPVVRNNNIHVSVLFCFYLFIYRIIFFCDFNFVRGKFSIVVSAKTKAVKRHSRSRSVINTWPRTKKIGKLVILTLDSFDSISLDLKKINHVEIKNFWNPFRPLSSKMNQNGWKISHFDTVLIRFYLFRFEKINRVEI